MFAARATMTVRTLRKKQVQKRRPVLIRRFADVGGLFLR